MKVAAHPMLVAVALGLLAPAALAAENEDERKNAEVHTSNAKAQLTELVQESVSSEVGPYWARLDISEADYPGEADHEAAEQAWLQARKLS